MRVESTVTSLSWIPSEAVGGVMRLPFAIGFVHWDPPPPDRIDDLEALRAADRFRFANRLTAWIDVDDDGAITDAGYAGCGVMGSTTIRLGGMSRTIPAVAFPDIRQEPAHADGTVTFTQTTGGRTGLTAPRRVNRAPFVQIAAPSVWTTLAVTLHADGTAEHEVIGASPFPRHWIYDDDGRLVHKSGVADFTTWSGASFGSWSPWGGRDHEAVVAEAETALERQLSAIVMRGGEKPRIRRVRDGALLTEQGAPGDELYLVLDGMLQVEVDGEPVAEVGPGAILGERAVLEGGTRTSTLRALTACRVAVARAEQLDRDALVELSQGHRREDRPVAEATTG